MHKYLSKFISLQVFLILLSTTLFTCRSVEKSSQNLDKALLWQVSGNGLTEPSYIFGTYHLLGEKFLVAVPETDAPFKNAKGIVVETVIDSSKLLSISMMAIMRDNKISNLLSAEDFKMVEDELYKLSSLNLKSLDMFKPAQINAMLVLFQSQKLNEKILAQYSGLPLDIYFASTAKKLGKPVTQLETLEAQMKMLLDHFPVEEQARQLAEYVKNNEMISKAHVDMLQLYMKRDLPGLLTMMESIPEELSGNSDFLLKDRNVNWVKKLPDVMKTGSQFIAVGAGHLPGKDGLIELLRQAGYRVDPVVK